MTSNATAVSYGQNLTDTGLELLRSILSEQGAAVGAESTAGDSRYQVRITELELPDATEARLAALRSAVADAAIPGVDTALVPGALRSASRKLLIMDVDSTLIQQEVIELLAAYAGKRDEVAAVTEAAMRGELDFAQSLHARVAVLAGLPADVVNSVRREVKLSEGAAELVAAFKAAGHPVAVVSGGFNQILEPIAGDLGLDYWQANELEIVDGALTGKVLGAVVDRAAKEKFLREWAAAEGIAMEHTIAVGDGANDLDMLGAAGIGVAFNAKPAVRAVADSAINMPYLDAVRHIAGV
ncbi:phosphoserine phosphatase SerB [Pseudarthrobacter chlorophenolicus A6]|uniref:phosphoserine phosphatase n=1 Tax=Pseudarthrobacter chlorophenolicus (strain ATCC 700700 / DSM 12829 / CIP 107037 / JCM 12360 / KCTC 9906 / NCIMB 13794 / A6) TaxID=452863 RepID=B8H7R9_PSECP|nr:phosphoserine phosphatase SerB [Pseudarthrobacter chlorophenolicus]ACL39849.1 phosphoserine phosphatase SerB [Pseudarthrobacter chlorophenolicus A6]SDQ92551.1 phosphoserine phosphatase [Pseudarthrobacter chlorophenolicus]